MRRAAGAAVIGTYGVLAHSTDCAAPVMTVGASAPNSEAVNRTDLWGFLRSGIIALAPPPSLVKCVGATFAGSMFALFGMIVEGQRTKRERLVNREELGKLIPQRPSPGGKEQETSSSPPASRSATVRAVISRLKPETSSEGALAKGSPTSTKSAPAATGEDRSSGHSSGSRPPRPAPLSRDGRPLTEAEKVERQIKSILNKLTRERFDTLYKQLLECCSSTEASAEIVSTIAREVFSKATVQHSFIEMYADLCAKLHADLQGKVEVNFKRALLDQCQHSFTAYLAPPRIDECLDYEERYEELVKYKTKMLGNVKLIGNLLRLRMLSPKIIFHCTDELLSIGSAEALETLCAFLETLGASFDTTDWPGHPRLDEVFTHVKTISEDRDRPARTRCLLQDLLDKRRNRWRSWPTKVSSDSSSGYESAKPGRTTSAPSGLGGFNSTPAGPAGGEVRFARRNMAPPSSRGPTGNSVRHSLREERLPRAMSSY